MGVNLLDIMNNFPGMGHDATKKFSAGVSPEGAKDEQVQSESADSNKAASENLLQSQNSENGQEQNDTSGQQKHKRSGSPEPFPKGTKGMPMPQIDMVNRQLMPVADPTTKYWKELATKKAMPISLEAAPPVPGQHMQGKYIPGFHLLAPTEPIVPGDVRTAHKCMEFKDKDTCEANYEKYNCGWQEPDKDDTEDVAKGGRCFFKADGGPTFNFKIPDTPNYTDSGVIKKPSVPKDDANFIFQKCAAIGGNCQCPSIVRYGKLGHWMSASYTDEITGLPQFMQCKRSNFDAAHRTHGTDANSLEEIAGAECQCATHFWKKCANGGENCQCASQISIQNIRPQSQIANEEQNLPWQNRSVGKIITPDPRYPFYQCPQNEDGTTQCFCSMPILKRNPDPVPPGPQKIPKPEIEPQRKNYSSGFVPTKKEKGPTLTVPMYNWGTDELYQSQVKKLRQRFELMHPKGSKFNPAQYEVEFDDFLRSSGLKRYKIPLKGTSLHVIKPSERIEMAAHQDHDVKHHQTQCFIPPTAEVVNNLKKLPDDSPNPLSNQADDIHELNKMLKKKSDELPVKIENTPPTEPQPLNNEDPVKKSSETRTSLKEDMKEIMSQMSTSTTARPSNDTLTKNNINHGVHKPTISPFLAATPDSVNDDGTRTSFLAVYPTTFDDFL